MSKKLLKIVALSAAILGFSANAAEYQEGWGVEVGAGKTVYGSKNRDKNFYFGEITTTHDDIKTTVPVFSHVDEFEHDGSYSLFAGVNYAFCNGFVVGAELSYTSNDQRSKDNFNDDKHHHNHHNTKDAHHHHNSSNSRAKLLNESVTLLAKGKYLIDFGSSIYPFIGAGVGISRMELSFHDGENRFSDLDKTRFAYMGTAGFMLDASKDIQLSLAYTIRGTTDIDCDNEHHYNNYHDDYKNNEERRRHRDRDLTSFDHLKNNVQNIEASIGFKL